MRSGRTIQLLFAAVLAATLALAGCGGGEPSGDETDLLVTRDFGATAIDDELSVPATAGLTAMRQLQAHNDVETSYGGRFVNSIDGLTGGGGKDWLFYVDGVDADKSAAEVRLSGGETVQWDYHPWQTVELTGAIVGAYPEPMLGRRAELLCIVGAPEACEVATTALEKDGVNLNGQPDKSVTIHLGVWEEARKTIGIPDISASPEQSGVFASTGESGRTMQLADSEGNLVRTLGKDAGLVFAYSAGDQVSWVVTGITAEGVKAAAELLDRDKLRGRFAMATDGGKAIPLPVEAAAGGAE